MLFFATGNANKFREVKKLVPIVRQLDTDLPEIQSMDSREIVSFKLYKAFEKVQDSVIVDDTGLYLECLNGFPGPLIKQMHQSIGSQGIYGFTEFYGNYRAMAKTCVGYISSQGKVEFFEGLVEGSIVEPRDSTSFGWDDIFLPDGFDKTYSQMPLEQKNQVSQRFQAIKTFWQAKGGDFCKKIDENGFFKQ